MKPEYELDTFCFYCQKDYKNLTRHIQRVHKGTYAWWNLLTKEEQDGKSPHKKYE